jgi:hypothetical protein
MSDEISGNVYILTNPSMPGLVKIGFTDDNTIDYRLTDLYTTGVPEPFKLEAYSKCNKARQLEKHIHLLLNEYRLNKDREFFKVPIETVLETLKIKLPDIKWNIGATYELIKKEYWLDSFKNKLNKLACDINEFEQYAENKNWYGKDKYSNDNFGNKGRFNCYVKNRVKYLKDGIERRDDAVTGKYDSLKDDDKYVRKELREIIKEFQNFKDNI